MVYSVYHLVCILAQLEGGAGNFINGHLDIPQIYQKIVPVFQPGGNGGCHRVGLLLPSGKGDPVRQCYRIGAIRQRQLPQVLCKIHLVGERVADSKEADASQLRI